MALIVVAGVGAVLFALGCGLIYPPAGVIAAGLLLMVAAYLIAEEGET